MNFFRSRNFAATTVVVIVAIVTALLEARLSWSFTFGALDALVGHDDWLIAMMVVRVSLTGAVVVSWLMNRPRALERSLIGLTVMLTLGIIVSTGALVEAILGPIAGEGAFFIADLVMLGVGNVLVFSIWYWLIDPPGLWPGEREGDEWEFLFPQRVNDVARAGVWIPGYVEYLYVSFVVSFTFGPADVVPLSRRAKLLIMLQTSISLIIIAVLAANVLTALTPP